MGAAAFSLPDTRSTVQDTAQIQKLANSKTEVKSGEEVTISFEGRKHSLRFESNRYGMRTGGDVSDIICSGSFTLKNEGEKVLAPLAMTYILKFLVNEIVDGKLKLHIGEIKKSRKGKSNG